MIAKAKMDQLKALGFDVDALVNAIKADTEVDFNLPTLLTQEQVNTLSVNIRKEGHAEGLATGKAAMKEIVLKDLKAKTGLTADVKDVDGFIEAYKALHGKDESELAKSFKVLQDKYGAETAQYAAQIKSLEKTLFAEKISSSIQNLITKETILPKDKLVILFNHDYEVESLDGGAVQVKQGGQVLKDNLQNPLSLEAVVNAFVDPYIKKGGMGGENTPGGAGGTKFTDPVKHTEYWQSKGENPLDHLDTLDTKGMLGK